MGMVRSRKSIGGAVGATLGNAPYQIGDLLRSAFGIALPSAFSIPPKLTASINVHGAFLKIDRWSSKTPIRERTLRIVLLHIIGQLSAQHSPE